VLQGSIKVKESNNEQIVATGEQLSIVDGKISKDRIYDLALAATWVNELLAMKGRDNQELGQRVNDLLARIGRTKMEEMYEGEIRALGDHCVLPLSRYIQSDLSKGPDQQYRRVTAARILSDVAQPWSIPELIALLADRDADVRYYAALGLKRLTAQTQGRSPEEWRDLPVAQTRENYQRWQTWWEKNKNRYPAGPMNTPGPGPDIKAKAKAD